MKKTIRIIATLGLAAVMATAGSATHLGNAVGITPLEVHATQREYEPTIFMRRLPRGNVFSQGHTITRDRFLRTYGNPSLFHFEGRMYTSADFFDMYSGQGFRWEINTNNPQGVRAHDVTLVVGHVAAPRVVANSGGTTQGATSNTPNTPSVVTPAPPASENDKTPTISEWQEGDAILFSELTILNSEELLILAEIAPSSEETRSAITLTNRRLTDSELSAWIEEYKELGGINDFELQVVRLINEYRAQHNLPPLAINPELSMAARFHSQEMVDLNFFSHTSPVTGGPMDRARMFGCYRGLGENIGGRRTPEDTVQGWLNSPGHRNAILSEGINGIGIGRAVNGTPATRFPVTAKFSN